MTTAMLGGPSHLELLDRRLGLRYTSDTRRNTLGQARRFIAFVGVKSAYTEDDILAYVDHLIGKGQKRGSIRVAENSIKLLCRAIGCKWPLDAPVHLPAASDAEGGPVLAAGEVRQLIAGALRSEPQVRALACLSTTYGLRVLEMVTILGAGLDGHRLRVTTAKARLIRDHEIPPALREYLTFGPQVLSRDAAQDLFQRLMKTHVRKPRDGEGWHAVRRALVTDLMQKVPEAVLYKYMGWTQAKTAYRYFRPTTGHVDQLIYKVHPFLEAWQ